MKKKAGTGEEDEELEKSFRQLLPSESHIKITKQEQSKERDQSSMSILMDLNQSNSFYQTNEPTMGNGWFLKKKF